MPRYNWRRDERVCSNLRPHLLKSLMGLTIENPMKFYRPMLFAKEARQVLEEDSSHYLYDRDIFDLIHPYIVDDLILKIEIQHRTTVDEGYQANLMKLKELEYIVNKI